MQSSRRIPQAVLSLTNSQPMAWLAAAAHIPISISQTPPRQSGLYSSSGESGSAFYSRRLSAAQYFGVSYDYSRTITNPPNSSIDIQMHSPLPFYTIYFNTKSSLSILRRSAVRKHFPGPARIIEHMVAGGRGEHGVARQPRRRFVSYLHVVTSGGGLLGAFHSDSVNGSGNVAINRTWSASLGVSYATISAVTQLGGVNYSGGNSFTANATLQHSFGEHFTVQGGYDRLGQNYNRYSFRDSQQRSRICHGYLYFQKTFGVMTMTEDSEDQGMERPDFERLAGIVRRRHFHFLIPLFVAWLAVWGASWIMSPRFKSSTLILVEQPSMPANYVAPNISDDLQTRLQSITTQILSRTRLLLIIDRLHLYGGTQNAATADEKVNRMRKDIDVELVRDPQKQDVSAFRISYSARDPRIAQAVTGELTDLFINENSKVRQQESEATTSFLEQQLEEARAKPSRPGGKGQAIRG